MTERASLSIRTISTMYRMNNGEQTDNKCSGSISLPTIFKHILLFNDREDLFRQNSICILTASL